MSKDSLGFLPTKLNTTSIGVANTDIWTADQWRNFGAQGGTVGDDFSLNYGKNQPGMFEGLGGMQGVGAGLQGLGSLGGLVIGLKNYGLAKDTFNFNKDMKEKEYAMAKDAYDRKVKRATSIGDQMRAGKVQ